MSIKIATVRLVFDRKHVASKTKKGLVQMEIQFDGKRKWISTNVKLYKGQWDDRRHVVGKTGMLELNEWLDGQVADLERWMRGNIPFTWEKLDDYLSRGQHSDNFIDFLSETINGRNDIRKTTRKAHRRILGVLREFGRIERFKDLTRANVMAFDNFLHGRKIRKINRDGTVAQEPMKQQSIYGYHKLMRTYIHIAINVGLMNDDPYAGTRFQKGESEPGRYLTAEELERLRTAEMRSGSVAQARDMFVFQAYTGLAYADLAAFDFSNADKEGGDYVYSGKRVKTGEVFHFLILPEAMRILEKYGYQLPVISGQSYNSNLKKAAKDAGIDKPIASHWARRTAGMMFLNAGVRLEVVAKILGHSSVRTTEKFYAEIQKRSVVDEMRRALD